MATLHTATEKEHHRSRADHWFETLDSQVVGTGPDRWTTMLFGVHELPGGTWLQLAAADDPVQSVILRLSSESTAVLALAALSAWSALPREERPRVIEVDVGTGIAVRRQLDLPVGDNHVCRFGADEGARLADIYPLKRVARLIW